MTATTEDPAGRWSSRWHRAAGLLLALYLVLALVGLAILRRDPGAYNRIVEGSASLGGRLLAWAAAVALVFHGLNGLRVVVLEATDASARVARRSRYPVVFVTATAAPLLFALVFRARLEDWWG